MNRRHALAISLAATAAGCQLEPAAPEHDAAHTGALFERAWDEARRGKADGTSCSGVRVPDRPGFSRRVALTFDDGPNLATTPDVVEILRRHDVPAAFFVNGQRVDTPAAEDLVAELAADPQFVVANHGWSHRQMTALGAGAVDREIDDTSAVLEAAGADPRYFRFPYGASSCATAEAVRARGLAVTGWHVDSADWCFSTGTPGLCPASQFAHVDDDVRDDMVGYTLRQIRASAGGIVLFHDIHRYTADRVEEVIEALEADGYEFVGIDDEGAFPLLNGASPEPDEPGPAAGGVTATVKVGLHLRAGPGTGHDSLAVMPAGSVVNVLEGPESEWYRLRFDGVTGWAHGGFLEF